MFRFKHTHAMKGQEHTRCSQKWDRKERELSLEGWGIFSSDRIEDGRVVLGGWELAGRNEEYQKIKRGWEANKPSGSVLSLRTTCFSGQQKIS